MPNVKIVDVKTDMPDVDTARRRLIEALEAARRGGVQVVKLVHGYGSTGVGGALRPALRKSLARRKKEGLIQHFVYGEKWTVFDAGAQKLLEHCPELDRDADLERGNEGITLILL